MPSGVLPLRVGKAYAAAKVFVQVLSFRGCPPGCLLSGHGGLLAGLPHFGPHGLGIGMPEQLENYQRVLPGNTGRSGITKCLVGVAERGERVRLVVAIAALTVQINCLLVASSRLALLPEMPVRVAQAVVCLGLA